MSGGPPPGFGMDDMLVSLETLAEPATSSAPVVSEPAAASKDEVASAWLASLPNLSYMLKQELVCPA